MRNFSIALGIVLFSAAPVFPEVVQTTDGRSIDLREDGTYILLEEASEVSAAPVAFEEPLFQHHQDEFQQKTIRFMPIFTNTGDVTIVGTKFTAAFKNAFGEIAVTFSGDSDEALPPGKTSTAGLFYAFKDNPFIANETYDKLLPLVTNGTGSIDVKADMIAYKDGTLFKAD